MMENVRNKYWLQRYVRYTRKFALSEFVVSGVDCIYVDFHVRGPFTSLASERSERDTIRGVQIRAGAVYVYVIARVGVKFGINFTSVRLSGNKIARGEAECYLPLNLTRVKFVSEISRLTVLLKINTIASLLFI